MLLTTRILPQFRYNILTQRYVAANGRFVSRETVKAAGESVVQQAGRDIEAVSLRFQRGEISHAQWDSEMRQNIRRLHVTQQSLACGGWENMTPKQRGRVGQLIREQYKYLNGMGQRIQSGHYGDDLSKNGFMNHATMYSKAGRFTFEYGQAMNAFDELGHDEVSNELDEQVEQHCKGPGSCPSVTGKWYKIGSQEYNATWSWPGHRLCGPGCQCRAKTRKAPRKRAPRKTQTAPGGQE